MEQEDKDILLKYLCMALPYGVMIKEEYGDYINVNLYNAHLEHLIDRISDGLDKLVLRPMSSMTKEEHKEYEQWLPDGFNINTVNWLLEHHFDFMGLTPKKLAIEITDKNNPYEN